MPWAVFVGPPLELPLFPWGPYVPRFVEIHVHEVEHGRGAAGADVPAPDGDHVRIVWCRAAPESVVGQAMECVLTPEERVRADRYRVAHARAEFVAGRWLVRKFIGDWQGLPPTAVEIRLDGRGRPHFEPPDHRTEARTGGRLDFSIAHAAGYVAVAFSAGRRTGLDLEPESSGSLATELAGEVLAPTERGDFDELSGDGRKRRFVDLWTTKEAVLKALGTGFLVEPWEVELAWTPVGVPRLERVRGHVESGDDWELGWWDAPPGFRGAVVLAPSGSAVRG